MAYETFTPSRWGRSPVGPYVRLAHPGNKASRTGKGCVIRIGLEALALAGLSPKRGDHYYFIVEVDRGTGALRLSLIDNPAQGRLMNPTNRQINLSPKFAEWTGWSESRWLVESPEPGVLVGTTREEIKS